MTTVSVIIPAFNRSETIRYCLESVVNQTFRPFEIIVVDDCSTDQTVEIVKGFSDHLVRCIVLEKNSGAQAARNCGMREARGEWIAFQDADDEWLPDKLEKQLSCLNEVGCDEMTVIHTDVLWLGKAYKGELPFTLPLVHGDNALQTLLQGPGPLMSTILVSQRALTEINYLDEDLPAYHEWDMAIRLARICRFIHIREPLVRYNRQQGSISSNGRRDLAGYQYVMQKFSELIRNFGGEHAWGEHLRKQAVRAMAFRLWSDARRFLVYNGPGDWRYFVLRIFIGLHISPQRFMRIAAYVRSMRIGREGV